MKSGGATPGSLGPPGGYLPKTDSYLPSAPSGGGGAYAPKKPDRPFESLGKASLNLYGTAGQYSRDLPDVPGQPSLVEGEAFKGVPVLEQAAQLVGGIANIPAAILSVPERISAARVWEQNASPERAQWEALVANNAISQSEAEARFHREMWEERHKADRGLFRDLGAPTGDYSLGGQLVGGLSTAFSLIQRPWERTTGGNVGTFFGSLARGDFRSPAEQRLESLRTATDEQLNYGAGEAGHPELISIRDRLNQGAITPDEAFDELIVAGFGVSNPVGTLPSIFNAITSDPANLLGMGSGMVARSAVKASTVGAKAFGAEVGQEALTAFGRQLSARGIVANEGNLLHHALRDPKMRPIAEEAIRTRTNRLTQFMVLDAPAIVRVGRAINGVLDPFTLFGRDSIGKATAEQFSRKLGSGVVNGYGASNYRSLVAHAAGVSDELAEVVQDGFDRAAAQIGAQVGNEQNIRHIRVTQSLDGIGNDATAAAMGSARRLGGDIARRAQDRVERTKLRIVPTQRGPAGVEAALRQARERAVNQLLSMAPGKIDRPRAEALIRGLTEEELSLLDFAHYGAVTRDLIAARNAGAVAGTFDQIERVTFIGPRQLTRPVLDELRKAVFRGQASIVRGMIERYDDLYRIYDLELADAELLRQLKETMDQLKEIAPTTLQDVTALPRELRAWLAKYQPMGYHLGLRPEDDILARPIMDNAGKIVGVNPWIDLVDEKTARQSIGRLQVLQRALFNNISGASVVRDAQHRFIRLGAERFGMPEQALEGLFSKVMQEASNRRTTARGLHPHEMYQIALDAGLPRGVRSRMTEREFAELVVEAHEGSLSKVGLTQKFTGKLKSSAMVNAGSNGLGILAERLYPMLRFTINPFFQLQELVETPFFMLLRGRIPMEDFRRVWTSAGRAEINDELDRTLWAMGMVERKGSFYMQDMMEYSLLTLHGNRAVNDAMKRGGIVNRLGKLVPNVARMKEWGVARSFQYEQAQALSRAVRQASPESWDNFSRWLAYRTGQRSDRAAVTNFIYDTVAKTDPDSAYHQFGPSALKPAHLGAQAKISTSLIRGLVYGEQGAKSVKWKDLLKEIADGTRPATEISDALTAIGADPIYIQRAVDMVTFPRPDEFYRAFTRLGRSEEEVAAIRASAQALARLKGISEHEQLSQMYAAAPAALNHLGEVKSRTLFQAIADSFMVRGMAVPERGDPNIAELAARGESYLPDFTMPEGWETAKVKDLTLAQQKRRVFEVARQRRAADPSIGLPPALDDPSRSVSMRGDRMVHKIGEVSGDEWWRMLSDVMDERTLREKADWYIDMRRAFLTLADNDPDEAARLITLFGVSQLNTSPVDGMKFVHRALAAHRRGEDLPIDPRFSGLNSAAIKALLEEGQLTEAGLGQKLIDFIDSLIGKRTRTAGPVGPDPLDPWGPVAGDIWAKRDLGFVDKKMAQHLGRVYGGRAVWEDGVGFRVAAPDGEFVIPAAKVTGGAPDDLEYDYIVEFYNARAREANQRGWLDRRDWSPAEMQALGWFRAKFAMGDQTGSPLDAFHRNTHSVYWEVAPGPGSRLADVFPGQERRFTQSIEGFARNRIAPVEEVTELRREGEEIIQRLEDAPSSPIVEFDHVDVRSRAFAAVQDEWGGATFDSHTGQLLKSDAIYHGTMAPFARSIERTGLQRGDLVNDVRLAKQYAGAGGVVFRTRAALGQGGTEKAPGWFEGMRVKPENMEVLRDLDTGVFEPVVPGAVVGEGPFTTALGETTRIPIEQVADEEAFNVAFDSFVEANRGELQKAGRYVGVFRNQDNGMIEFDVAVTVPTKREAEALQLAAGREGGAYDHWSGNGVFAPTVGEPVEGLPEDVAKAITKDIGAFVAQEASALVGVQVLARFDGVGAWSGGLNPNASFEVLGTSKDAQAFARATAYLSQQEAVPVSRLSPLGANAAEGRLHAVDWAPGDSSPGATYAEAEAALRQLAASSPLARGGSSIVRYDDGSYGVRAVWFDHNVPEGTIPMGDFRAAHPDSSLGSVEGFEPRRVVVESSYHENDYTQFPNGEGHLNWLRENGYASVADKLAGSGRDRASLFYERTYRKHFSGGLDQWRANRALDDDEWARRAGPLLDDLDTAYGSSVALDPTAGPDLLGRAADAAARGDALFQRHPRGTLGAIAFDDADGRARVYLNAKRTNSDTLLHELSHQFAEQALDPSGRKAILDAYNLDVGRATARRTKKALAGIPAAATTWTEDVHEWFAKQMIEWVRTGDAPARHLEPIFGFYSKYLKTTTSKVKMSPEAKAILNEVTARPVQRASAANMDEVALMNMMIGEADRAARNARDLIHFRTNRSWVERSLNHPYFGMYPLSYMWGKVLPELIEFLTFRPFGVKAPFVAYNTVGDVYRAVMIQQENDPELRQYLEDNEPALRAIAMLTPGVPWDLPVNTPLWLRRVSEAIATQQQRVLDGKTNPDGTPATLDLSKVDYGRIVTDTAGYALNPVRGVENIVDSATGIVGGLQVGANLAGMGDMPTSEGPDPRTLQPPALTTEQPQPTQASEGPLAPQGPLGNALVDAEQDLTEALSAP